MEILSPPKPEDCITGHASAGSVCHASVPEAIYRPFFRAGIAVALTFGAGWGVLLLLRIAWSGQFGGLSAHEINAHGHAQIFGWVGLFVMGFAYQFFPRFKQTALAYPQLAYGSFGMMLAGLIIRSLAQMLTVWWPRIGTVGVAASVLEIVAAAIVLLVVTATLRRCSQKLEVSDYYILAALGWFFVQTVAEMVYFAAMLLASERRLLVDLVATWQGSLREMQIHGFATLMILGVSLRLLPRMFGLAPTNARKSGAALLVFNGALVGVVAGLTFMRIDGRAWAALWYAGVVALAGSVVGIVWGWGLFSQAASQPGNVPNRSLKFIRTAYAWLFISLAMTLLLPVYQLVMLPRLAPESTAAQMGFSHAYYGAIRHAVTVGFVSMMIVGVASHVVPRLSGMNPDALSPLWLPYMLLLAGCTLRVTSQSMTDFTPWAFPAAGVSGLLEFIGLSIWGLHMWRLMAVPSERNSGRNFVSCESLAMRNEHLADIPCANDSYASPFVMAPKPAI